MMALVKLRPAIWPIKYFVLAMAAPATLCAAGLMVASCGPIQSAQVQDQINGMIGLSKERVLSCMGPPTSTAQAGATEVWSYNSLGPVTTSALVTANQSLAIGSTTTSQEYCAVNLTMQNDRVTASNYRSLGKLLSPSLPCYTVLHACVPNPAAVAQAAQTRQAIQPILAESITCSTAVYQSPKAAPLRVHLPYNPKDATPAQLSDRAFATENEIAALQGAHQRLGECRQASLSKLSGVLPAAVPPLAAAIAATEGDQAQLFARKMTWGEYTTRGRDRAVQLEQTLLTIR
jgi:hypothetical protein